MPEKNKENIENTKEEIGEVNSVNLIERQGKILDDLEKAEISREDLLALSNRLFEHSLEDGMRIAERVKLTPKEILGALSRRQFFIKHLDFSEKFAGEINMRILRRILKGIMGKV